jgi:hypothetical protein
MIRFSLIISFFSLILGSLVIQMKTKHYFKYIKRIAIFVFATVGIIIICILIYLNTPQTIRDATQVEFLSINDSTRVSLTETFSYIDDIGVVYNSDTALVKVKKIPLLCFSHKYYGHVDVKFPKTIKYIVFAGKVLYVDSLPKCLWRVMD